jgi:hypothetical protein
MQVFQRRVRGKEERERERERESLSLSLQVLQKFGFFFFWCVKSCDFCGRVLCPFKFYMIFLMF